MGAEEAHGTQPFVGRDAEIEQLRTGLDQAAAGRGRLYMIVGEPGIGKTRLADEVAQRAERQGLPVLWGRCWESGGAPAYWPWAQILRGCASRLDAATLTATVRASPDLVHVVPELRARVPDLPEPTSTEPELGRFRVLDAAASLLRHAAAARPLVLLLDDLHAADQSSLMLLRFIARELRSLPILVVGTYRDAEAARDPVVSQILADVLREGQRIPLRGLSPADVASYIATAAPQRVAATTVDSVYAVTEGNPLFLTEVIRLWIAEQARLGKDTSAPGFSIPEELRAAIRQRLAPLPESVRRVLTIAAVQGREFDIALVERVMRRNPAETPTPGAIAEAADVARAAGIVQPVANTIGRLSFAHVLIRDVLYDDLRSTERTELHRALAEALERTHAADPSPHLAEIAHHYIQATADGDVDKAVEFARRAGERALLTHAYEDAVQHFEHAMQALLLRREGPRPPDQGLQCELLLLLGDGLWGAGDLTRMRETYQRAAVGPRSLPPNQAAPQLARAALGFGGRQQRAHLVFDVEGVRMLEDARHALGEADSPLRARVLARLAYALYTQPGSHPRREQFCREAVAMARRVGDPITLRWVLNDWRWALWGPDTIDERLEIATELVHLAERMGDHEMALVEHSWRMVDLLELGNLPAFAAELDIYTRLARAQSRPWYAWYILRFTAMRELMQGRFAEAERLCESGLDEIQRTEHQDAYLVYGTQMLAIRTEQGRLTELEAGVQAFVAQYPGVAIWRYVLAFLHSELERRAEAQAEVDRIAAPGQVELPGDYLRLAAGAYLAEAYTFLGDAERAKLLYDILRPYASRCVIVGFGVVCLGSVSRYLGMLAGTMGQSEAAARHFEDSLATNLRLGARPAMVHTQLAYARMLLTAGAESERATAERERAHRLLREAYVGAVELGMQSVESKALALARTVGLDVERVAPSPAMADSDDVGRQGAVSAEALVCRLCREGEYWSIGFGEQLFRMKHLRGLAYIKHLLQRPGEEVHVFDLLDLADGVSLERGDVAVRDDGDAGPMIDASARAAYKARLRELREELEEAEEANDLGRAQRYREEMSALTEHLAAATGLGGRDRSVASQANRARVAVAKAIRVSVGRIEEHNAEIAAHLDLAIKTGIFCSYNPDPLHPLVWDLS